MDLAPDFNEFFELLNANRVEYVVVGGYALALHGAPRYTGDIDILERQRVKIVRSLPQCLILKGVTSQMTK